ncbi:MAG: ribosomal protein S18-alanine N-acetyltransferase [Enterobacterales bacterium]|nr:ribosomal protein S18-alanine N-acetyltransferase [Enterobacterales bacterium]
MIQEKSLNWMIRKACIQDLDQILVNEKLCYATPWSDNLVEQSITSSSEFFVMLVGHKIAGHIVFQQVLDEIHLHNICIAPQWQRSGLAKQWLTFLTDFATQKLCNCILLEVRCSNQIAIQFYLKSGFGKIGYRKNYYSTFDGSLEDALVMKRMLAPKTE